MIKIGDLQVWWIPQVPGKPFTVDVSSVAEAVKIMTVLANYDLFQFHNHVKPDYANAGGLNVWTRGLHGEEWASWEDEETGEDDPEVWLESKVCLLSPYPLDATK